MLRRSAFATILTLIGCANASAADYVDDWAEIPPSAWHLTIEDLPDQRAFRLVLYSRHYRQLCVSNEQWPTRDGGVRDGSTSFELVWASGRKFGEATMEEYCPGCGYELPARGRLVARIKYEVFGEPDWVAALPERHLEVTLRPAICE